MIIEGMQKLLVIINCHTTLFFCLLQCSHIHETLSGTAEVVDLRERVHYKAVSRR